MAGVTARAMARITARAMARITARTMASRGFFRENFRGSKPMFQEIEGGHRLELNT